MIFINTKILSTDEGSLKEAASIIKSGGIVAFPTETVYGIGANIYNEEAIKNIFKAKGRPADNPLIVHISSFDMLSDIVSYIPDSAKILMDAFMPGPLTIIMKKSDKINPIITAGLDTVAVRFPSHPIARKFIEFSSVPIAAPSANLSGKPSPTIARHVIDDLTGRVDAIFDGGMCDAGLESTVIDCTGDIPLILRPGIITLEDVQEFIPEADIDKDVLSAVLPGDTPRCPGMKYKHYAPDAKVIVVEGEKEKVINKIKSLLSENSDFKTGVLSCSGESYKCNKIINIENGNKGYAHGLYTSLRLFDENAIDIVFAEFYIDDKYSVSVKNRLYKSASNNIIYV